MLMLYLRRAYFHAKAIRKQLGVARRQMTSRWKQVRDANGEFTSLATSERLLAKNDRDRAEQGRSEHLLVLRCGHGVCVCRDRQQS